MALFKFPEKNLNGVLEDKMKETFTDLIIQLSANDISFLQFLDDQDLKLNLAAKNTRNSVNVVKAAVLQNRYLRKIRKKIEVEKSGLEDKIKIGSLSTIQLETERYIVGIFGSMSSVAVDLHHMRGQKGGEIFRSYSAILKK